MNYSGVVLSDVEKESPEWLWEGWIPRMFMTLFMGDQNGGKSTFRDDLIARITMGRPMPDGSANLSGQTGVILITLEEDVAGVVLPRLEQAGADTSRVLILNQIQRTVVMPGDPAESDFTLPDDLKELERWILRFKASLVVIDPVMSVLSVKYAKSGNQMLRQHVINPMQHLCARLGIGMLVVCHYTKSRSPDWSIKLGGSKAWGDAARSAIELSTDSNNASNRILTCVKHSNTPSQPPQIVFSRTKAGTLDYLTGLTTQQSEVQKAGRLSQSRRWVIELLDADITRVFSPLEIAQETAVDYEYLRGLLRTMVGEGVIASPGRAHYQSIHALTTVAP